MNTSEKIAAAIKGILDDDRRADRERIAELERDLARALVREREANERTGAAIHRVQSLENGAEWERKDVNATIAALNKQLDELTEKCAALVVERNSLTVENNHLHAENKRLVETPAVKQEEQGPWVVYDDPHNLQVNPCMGLHGWGKISDGLGPFDVRSDAVAALNGWVMGGFSRTPRIITLAEARAIEAKR